MTRPPEFTEITVFDEWHTALEETATEARQLLEQVWSPQTAYHGITLAPEDTPSRGQCGVSALWLSRYLRRHGVNASFVDGTVTIENVAYPHVWAEAQHARFGAQVLDIASDQYRAADQRPVYVDRNFGISPEQPHASRLYRPEAYFEPYQVPRPRLLDRYATLERAIGALPLRNRMAE